MAFVLVPDPRGGQTSMAYDPAGRIEGVTNAKNVITESYAYDSGDRMTTGTDASNRQMLYEYDPFGRLSRTIDRKGQATSYDYDGQDRVITVTRTCPEG